VSSQIAAWFLERIFDLLMALLISLCVDTRARRGRSTWGQGSPGPGRRRQTAALASVALAGCAAVFAPLRPAHSRCLVRRPAPLPTLFLQSSRAPERLMQGVESTQSDGACCWSLMYSCRWALIAACYEWRWPVFLGASLSFVDVVGIAGVCFVWSRRPNTRHRRGMQVRFDCGSDRVVCGEIGSGTAFAMLDLD